MAHGLARAENLLVPLEEFRRAFRRQVGDGFTGGVGERQPELPGGGLHGFIHHQQPSLGVLQPGGIGNVVEDGFLAVVALPEDGFLFFVPGNVAPHPHEEQFAVLVAIDIAAGEEGDLVSGGVGDGFLPETFSFGFEDLLIGGQ